MRMLHLKSEKFKKWGNGVLTSLLGTTLSIILTFGTSEMIENQKKADLQKETAMMVIHDIDVCVDRLEEIAAQEEKMNGAVQYVLAHQEQLEALAPDTLELAMQMITQFDAEQALFDDAKENIFKSSQDIWSNLDNMTFVDNMEKFYYERRSFQNQIQTSPMFSKPIGYNDFWQMVFNSTSYDHSVDYVAILKEKLKEPRTRIHIDYSQNRIRMYRRYAQNWRDISDRNKFIMNISDEELANYIKDSQRSGNAVKRRNLIGMWERQSQGIEKHYYEFLPNDSFRIKAVTQYANPFYNGDILWIARYGGKWQVKGDSLIMEYDAESSRIEIDRKNVTYRPEMRDSVESFISRYFNEEERTAQMRQQLKLQPKRDALSVTINKGQDKLEVKVGRTEDETVTLYFKRLKDSDMLQ